MSEHDYKTEKMEPDEVSSAPAAEAPPREETLAADNTEESARLREENAQLFARLQRLQADFDNYRKRTKAERQEWCSQAVCELIRELLPVLDNLERARQAEATTETLSAGIELVYRQLISILEKQGLSTIEACGIEFDPNFHHAIMQVESDAPENTVVEELQKGYSFNNRVLRASLVKVANQHIKEES